MSEMSSRPVNDFNIYLSFHLVNDTTYATQKKYVESLISKLFPESYSLEYEDPSQSADRELVYRIQKPVINSADAHRQFFINMSELFTKTQRYLPSFTQGLETHP